MSGPAPTTGWEEANRDHLVAELAVLRLLLRPDPTEADRREADEALSESMSWYGLWRRVQTRVLHPSATGWTDSSATAR
ncbi:hypothetical protein, partial [Streptomyces sp. NPDC041003]|uniref:hypothetical protein n=1 Tax=Streptomyces sp. NPDC041003 TaxID=3155730 RepID=UPI0033F8D3CA